MHPTCNEVLDALARRTDDFINEKGEVSSTKLGLATGVKQSTLHRILQGSAKSPRPETVNQLAAFFKVSPAQLRGETEIPGLFERVYDYPDQPELVSEENLMRMLETFTVEEKRDWCLRVIQKLDRPEIKRLISDLLASLD